ncbi:alpha/beta fold hydrolase [Polycladidibacter stylochi]|uniref:alpha/beta fold hydrolase n=1 Tax=Polycladidibacter stylochi TaxID=1807766 RepID=UPI00082BF8E3|nr:alpha/beta fold hydrolase [Pseudovibrio stylochi]
MNIVQHLENTLPYISFNNTSDNSIIFIHGFGSDANTWHNIQQQFSKKYSSIAFHLPAHGKAQDWPRQGNAITAAKEVQASLKNMEITHCHLVGHSMGGAIAALIAMKNPQLVKSLTLLAPGGFGHEINYPLMQAYANINSEAEARRVLQEFVAPTFKLPRKMPGYVYEQRIKPGMHERLNNILAQITKNGEQGTLPLDKLASTPYPLSVIWGEQDAIVPVSQLNNLPPSVARPILKDTGHMVHLERPQETITAIKANIEQAT